MGNRMACLQLTSIIMLFSIGSFFFPLYAQEISEKVPIIFIDTRLLVISHPLFAKFDPESRRFRDTSGDPSLVKTIGFEGLDKAISDSEVSLAALPKKWDSILKKAKPPEKKKLEGDFLRERKALEKELEVLRGQKNEIKVIPGYPTFSERQSLLKQVCEISRAIQKTAQKLIDRYSAPHLIDAAGLMTNEIADLNTRILYDKISIEIWRKKGAPVKKPPLFTWIGEAKKYWSLNDELFTPIPFGAKDCRFEAVNLMEASLGETK